MTRGELRNYVDEQRSLNNIPYHVYSALIDGIDTLEQEICEDSISRADAIKAVTTMCEEYTPTKSTYHPHIDFVVEELNKLPSVQPKPTGCEDCISRQAVNTLVDELARAISDERCCMSRGRATSSIMQDILDLPSVTPKQKMGKWIMPVQDDGMSDPIYYQVRCSECGFDLDPQTWHMELHQYGADKYCPNCGARMGESEDRE